MNVDDTDGQATNPVPDQPLQRKKCHGNRRDQRFRRKCRAQKMKPSQIAKRIAKKKRFHRESPKNNSQGQTTSANRESTAREKSHSQPVVTTSVTHLHKRKREASSQQVPKSNPGIPKTTSSISILQPPSKKQKSITETTNNPTVDANETGTNSTSDDR